MNCNSSADSASIPLKSSTRGTDVCVVLDCVSCVHDAESAEFAAECVPLYVVYEVPCDWISCDWSSGSDQQLWPSWINCHIHHLKPGLNPKQGFQQSTFWGQIQLGFLWWGFHQIFPNCIRATLDYFKDLCSCPILTLKISWTFLMKYGSFF